MIKSKQEYVDRMKTDKHIPSVTRVLKALNWYPEPSTIPDHVMKFVIERGITIHEYVDRENKGLPYDVDLLYQIHMDYFFDWRTDYKPTIMASELYVFNENKYRGILDMVVEIDGLIYVVDLKISSSYMPYKAKLQMAAYAKAVEASYGIKVDRLAMLRISKTGYEWITEDDIETHYKAFETLIPYYKELSSIWGYR